MIEHIMEDSHPIRAIRIDPDKCTVELTEVAPADVATVLGSQLTGTIDLEDGHCLVVDDGSHDTDHSARFHFKGGRVTRPFFGSALILGYVHGNWEPATLEPGSVSARIIWEQWDRRELRYMPAVAL